MTPLMDWGRSEVGAIQANPDGGPEDVQGKRTLRQVAKHVRPASKKSF